MVQANSGGYTQIVSFVSSFWMVLVLVFLAPYLFWLPKAVLSSVIVVNLRGLFLKYRVVLQIAIIAYLCRKMVENRQKHEK